MVKTCDICGSSGFVITSGDETLCLVHFEQKSPFIDEVWRIVNDALTNNLEWVDIDAVEKRRKTRKYRD